MKLFKKAKKGFTLVELVVVIAVIAILAAVSVGAYFGVTESAKNSKADQEAKAVHTAIMLVVNDPNSGYTMSREGVISEVGTKTYATDPAIDDFEETLEHFYGLDLATANAEKKIAFGTAEGAIYRDTSGFYYITTDLIAREIVLSTGEVKTTAVTFTTTA